MKNWKVFIFMALITVIEFAVVGCKPEPDPVHEHQWEWRVTTNPTFSTEGAETETFTTCVQTNGTVLPTLNLEF